MWRSEAEVKSSWITFHLISHLNSELQGSTVSAFHGLELEVSPHAYMAFWWVNSGSHIYKYFLSTEPSPRSYVPFTLLCFCILQWINNKHQSLKSERKISFLCVWVFCLRTLQFACALHACLLATEARKRHWTSWGWNYRAVVQHGIWELSSLPLNHCTEPFPHTERVKNFKKLEKAL